MVPAKGIWASTNLCLVASNDGVGIHFLYTDHVVHDTRHNIHHDNYVVLIDAVVVVVVVVVAVVAVAVVVVLQSAVLVKFLQPEWWNGLMCHALIQSAGSYYNIIIFNHTYNE